MREELPGRGGHGDAPDPTSSGHPARRPHWILSLWATLVMSCSPQAPEDTVMPVAVTNRLISPEQANLLAALESREQGVADTLWAPEMLAQRCGRTIDAWWDGMLASTNRLGVLAEMDFEQLVLPVWGDWEAQGHGVEAAGPLGLGEPRTHQAWSAMVGRWRQAGWQLHSVEFRHVRFEPGVDGEPHRSEYRIAGELANDAGGGERWLIQGTLGVVWGEAVGGAPAIPIQRLDGSRVMVQRRRGPPPFRLIQDETIDPPENSHSIDPLIAHDLDGDGLPEIVLAARNLVYRRQPSGRYQPDALWGHPPGLISAAVLGDFDGDAAVDFVVAKHEGLALLRGGANGTFQEAERMAFLGSPEMKQVSVMTAGDADGDGDLDLFVAQYRVPYENGSMPTPYFDANDGYPSFLLLNDGQGRFSDATAAAGLTGKRHRRSYSASFVDLDQDRMLDLVVVSDFAGLDLYRNLGGARFSDVTRAWCAAPRGFGMAHSFADFNADGHLDLIMMGMPSPTASRLEHLGLWRETDPAQREKRAEMIHGNRLLVSKPGGGFDERSEAFGVANSGWSWGCVSPDFDNDGFPDLYVANGLESRKSVEDYEAQFWLHDAFVGNSSEDSTAYLYFMSKFNRTRGRGQSYGGYERNRLYLNRNGRAFVEVGGVFGLGSQEDSRNVVSEDLNGDGRMDLVFTSFAAWPRNAQTLRIYESQLDPVGSWIGLRLRPSKGVPSPIGVEVRLHFGTGRTVVRSWVTGDGYRSQSSATVHFGLGSETSVTSLECLWPGERRVLLKNPAPNRYHTVSAPESMK
ncbi:MAG: CRTAC1 family protein [Verrucomicrobiales bacterium]|nr:CRTAC1 family protein [Verrucomicrobiales bacterium]